MKKSQFKYYTNILKEGEYLLLKSKDSYFKSHYKGSLLNDFTNFSGTAGEAVLSKNGKIKIFVDTRYHILVEKQVYKNIEIVKVPLNETFFDAFKKEFPKKAVFYLPYDIDLSEYMKYDSYFDLRTYKPCEEHIKNESLNLLFLFQEYYLKKAHVFLLRSPKIK